MDRNILLKAENLRAGYGGGEVLHGVSLEAAAGEILCVTGPNACGKSTLLRALARVIPARGTVVCKEAADSAAFVSTAALPRKALARRIGLLSQIPGDAFPFTVYETVATGCYARQGGLALRLDKMEKININAILEQLSLLDKSDKLISTCSGGELQRVLLARVLAQDPLVILLDEPTSHLDIKHQAASLTFLRDWARTRSRAVVAVIHDLNLARVFADRALLMADGKAVASGPPEAVFTGEALSRVYGMDVRAFFTEALAAWEGGQSSHPPRRGGWHHG
jgi:iron complex transport system ATP-binding protein